MDSAATVDSVANDLKKQSLKGTENVDISSKLNIEELNWDNSFVRELPGDPRSDSIPREVCFNFSNIFVFLLNFYQFEPKRSFFYQAGITLLYSVRPNLCGGELKQAIDICVK